MASLAPAPERYPLYVQSIQRDAAEAHAELSALYAGIADVIGYLSGAKFAEWPYANTADVLHRLQAARMDALHAASELLS